MRARTRRKSAMLSAPRSVELPHTYDAVTTLMFGFGIPNPVGQGTFDA